MAGMASNGTSPKRWRPRFSLRTLVIFMTLVCVYFGAWETTKRFGIPDVTKFVETHDREFSPKVLEANSALPCWVRVRQRREASDPSSKTSWAFNFYRSDYLWMFGWILHLRDQEDGMTIHGGVI